MSPSRSPLLLLCLLLSAGASFNFTHRFLQRISPCDDFHQHVCNFADNPNDSFVFEMREKFTEDVVRLLQDYEDPVLDFARKILSSKETEKAAYEEGRRMGMKGALFQSPMRVNGNFSTYTVDLEYRAPGKIHSRQKCYFDQCPPFVRGVLAAFTKYSFLKPPIDLATWKLHALYPADYNKLGTLDGSDAARINRRILETKELNPYVNLVVSKLAAENGLWISEEMLQKLQEIFEATTEEIVRHMWSKWWLSREQKLTLLRVLRGVQPLLFLPAESRNPQSLRAAFDVYLGEFHRNKAYLDFLIESKVCDTNCLLVHLGRVVHQGMWSYHERYYGTSQYIEFWMAKNTQFAVGKDSAFGGKGKVNILPTILQYMRGDLPIGLLYSAAATVIGHEFLHNLDTIDADEDAATVLWRNPVYKEGFECYRRHYGSFSATSPGGDVAYPDGDLQKNEGFADVEGLRVALRVFRQLEPTASADDLRWFFYGVEFFRCVEVADDYELLLVSQNSPHPRYTVRGKAQMSQVREFSEVFRCRRGDPMFLVENPCELFVPN